MRAYRPGEEAQILALFRRSFGQDMDESYWRWRFRDSPAGPGAIYLAWDGDVLAAHYAATSVTLRIQGRDWPTGLSGTTMTHPDYGGRGLFPLLARATYEHMGESGRAAVWGFPNAMSHRGFVRDLAWADVYEVPTLRLSSGDSLRLRTATDRVVELANFDHRFDRLWGQVREDTAISVRRDRAYLQWRYADNPAERYRTLAYVDGADLKGYVVFKRFRTELQVVDILAEPDVDVGLALVSKVAELCHQEQTSSLSLWLNVSHPLHHVLERAGFENGEPVTYLGALALRPELAETGLSDYRNWYVTMGDSDVF